MKKKSLFLIVFSLSLLLLGGCFSKKNSTDKPAEETEEQVEPVDDTKESVDIIEEFRALAQEDPTPDKMIQFIDEKIEKVSTEEADEMIDTLRYSLETNRPLYEEKLFELDTMNELIEIDGSEPTFQETSIDEINNTELKTEVSYLYNNFYQLINLEGQFYPMVNYSQLKDYEDYLSEEMKSYLEIKSIESDERAMADGGLVISFEELAARIFKSEDYLALATAGERKDDILEDYEYKINAYLKGLPNTPIMDYETKKINPTVWESYKNTADIDYEISTAVNEYIKIIQSNNNQVDDELLQKADGLIMEVLAVFEVE